MTEYKFLQETKATLEGLIRVSEEQCRQNKERLEAVNILLEKVYGAESEEADTTPPFPSRQSHC